MIAISVQVSPFCIVMYGGGITSYENAKRSIEKYGHENTEIWFADTRVEDQDLYRFNNDVEQLLNKEIQVFTRYDKNGKEMDIWDVFYEQRMLGNSRLDPCSKYLKRVPLRKALDERFCQWKCTVCGTQSETLSEYVDVEDIDNLQKKKGVCKTCMDTDKEYAKFVSIAITNSEQLAKISAELEAFNKSSVALLKQMNERGASKEERDEIFSKQGELVSERSRLKMSTLESWEEVDFRMVRVDENGRGVVVTLGMDNIEDCHRMNRARQYWIPYEVDFPLIDEPVVRKSLIRKDLAELGIDIPRLYKEGFKHNNCGGFCVKAGMGQFAHLYKVNPRRYLEYENKEQEFREFIGKDVSILRRVVNGEKINLTMRMLRHRIDAGDDFKFDVGEACSCVNPIAPD